MDLFGFSSQVSYVQGSILRYDGTQQATISLQLRSVYAPCCSSEGSSPLMSSNKQKSNAPLCFPVTSWPIMVCSFRGKHFFRQKRLEDTLNSSPQLEFLCDIRRVSLLVVVIRGSLSAQSFCLAIRGSIRHETCWHTYTHTKCKGQGLVRA